MEKDEKYEEKGNHRRIGVNHGLETARNRKRK